jgi:hypothetical protein
LYLLFCFVVVVVVVVLKGANCLGLLCEEIDIIGTDPNNAFVANYQVYKGIATSATQAVGRVAQQLAIRRLLRKVERQTTGYSPPTTPHFLFSFL